MAVVDVVRRGDHYTVGQTGPLSDLDSKLFLGPALELTGMEVSLNCLKAGQGSSFVHQHRQHEELYIFLKGRGQFQVDGDIVGVQPGTVLRVTPAGKRAWRNHGREDLEFVVIQANIGTLTGQDGVRHEGPVEWPE